MNRGAVVSAEAVQDAAEARALFGEWRLHNKPAALREQSLGMLACMIAMLPLDYIFFPLALAPWCTLLRVISMAVAGAGLVAERDRDAYRHRQAGAIREGRGMSGIGIPNPATLPVRPGVVWENQNGPNREVCATQPGPDHLPALPERG